jgi:hypothetical protein
VFCNIIDLLLPRYHFCVIFSVETTKASMFFCSGSLSNRFARSTDIGEAEQPIPPKLKLSTLLRIPRWLKIINEIDGVGQNKEQFATIVPISLTRVLVALSRSSMLDKHLETPEAFGAECDNAAKCDTTTIAVYNGGGRTRHTHLWKSTSAGLRSVTQERATGPDRVLYSSGATTLICIVEGAKAVNAVNLRLEVFPPDAWKAYQLSPHNLVAEVNGITISMCGTVMIVNIPPPR